MDVKNDVKNSHHEDASIVDGRSPWRGSWLPPWLYADRMATLSEEKSCKEWKGRTSVICHWYCRESYSCRWIWVNHIFTVFARRCRSSERLTTCVEECTPKHVDRFLKEDGSIQKWRFCNNFIASEGMCKEEKNLTLLKRLSFGPYMESEEEEYVCTKRKKKRILFYVCILKWRQRKESLPSWSEDNLLFMTRHWRRCDHCQRLLQLEGFPVAHEDEDTLSN